MSLPAEHCPDCGSLAWREIGTTGRFVLCRLCDARWDRDVLAHVATWR